MVCYHPTSNLTLQVIGRAVFPITEGIIHFDEEGVKDFQVFYEPADDIVNLTPALTEGANPEADTAIGAYLSPVLVAFLVVRLPLEIAPVITFVYRLEASLAERDSPRGAMLSTFLALAAELSDPKIDGLVHSQGQVGNHL